MDQIVLAHYGKSFATRGRARSIAGEFDAIKEAREIVVDVAGIVASPSFLAELLVSLPKPVLVIGPQDSVVLHTVETLRIRLGLSDSVRIEPQVPA